MAEREADDEVVLPAYLRWLLSVLRRDGLALLLGASLVVVAGGSFDTARWVRGAVVTPGMLFGLLLGALLARSRWRGRWAAAYLAFVLGAVAIEQVGYVLPVGQGLGLGDWVWTLHLRSVTWLARAGGWLRAIAAGEVVQDTGLFVFLVSLLTWLLSAWLAWAAMRRQQGLAAVAPLAMVVAANVHLSGQPWQVLWLYALLAVPLVLSAALARQYADWRRRGVDHPMELGYDWLPPTALLLLLVGVLAGVAPLAASPQGWEVLRGLMRSSQEQVEETASQLFAGVSPPRAEAAARRAVTPDLSRIGEPVDQGQDTVMWVRVSDPPPPPISAESAHIEVPRHYWRSGLFATYTGPGWQPLTEPMEDTELGDVPAPAGRYALRQDFEILASHDEALFAVSMPVSGTGEAHVLWGIQGDGTALLHGQADSYSVLSWATRVTVAELRAAPAEFPPDLLATYTQLPPGLPQRVRDLAQEVVAGAADNYERAVRVQDYLRSGFAYDLDVPPAPEGRDAVDYFLFEQRGGFCSHFASAMAVLLRAQGVPARVASGYAMGEYDYGRGAFRVPGAAAHAWVEVYFTSYGWVEFEPTPAQPALAYAEGAVAGTPAPPTGEVPVRQTGLAWRDWVALAALLVAGAALLSWAWERRRSRPDPLAGTPRGRALRLYGRLRRALARAGLRAPSSATPDEFLSTHAAALKARPPLGASVARATAVHERAAYSPHPVDVHETAEAERLWGRARWAWLGLVVGRFIRR
jgi:transglutaminase-like putative cysteine protease